MYRMCQFILKMNRSYPSGSSFGSLMLRIPAASVTLGPEPPRSRDIRLITIWPRTFSLSSVLFFWSSNRWTTNKHVLTCAHEQKSFWMWRQLNYFIMGYVWRFIGCFFWIRQSFSHIPNNIYLANTFDSILIAKWYLLSGHNVQTWKIIFMQSKVRLDNFFFFLENTKSSLGK